MAKVDEKVTCQYCGKEFSKAGIANHEKSCPKNPANIKEEVEAVVEVEVQAVEETAKVAVEEKLIDIKMRESIDSYIGDKYYRLKAGEVYSVTENVKAILQRAGLLDAV